MLEGVGVVNGRLNMERLNAVIGHSFKLFESQMRNRGSLCTVDLDALTKILRVCSRWIYTIFVLEIIPNLTGRAIVSMTSQLELKECETCESE